MEKQYIFNRRTLLSGAVAVTTIGLLAACGGGSKKEDKVKAPGKGAKAEELYNINSHPVSDLKQGGELRIPVTAIGPDFNIWSQSGNSYSTARVLSTMRTAGLYKVAADGAYTLDKDYCEKFEVGKKGNKVAVAIKMNPKAKFNDGTPIDIKALRATWKIHQEPGGKYNIVTAGPYPHIESIEPEGKDGVIQVVFKDPYYPIEDLFGYIAHPALEDPEVFNKGFVDKPRPEYSSGPFTVKEDGWNSSSKTFTVVANEKWWGEKPVLDRIIFRALEAGASRAAFKNGEIDAVVASTPTAYAELKDTNGAQIRRGQRLFSGGLNLNPNHIKDAKVRKAIFVGTDRQALANVNFQGLPYEEDVPGSMVLMPFSPLYEDNFPKPEGGDRKAAAQKILEEAGYTKGSDGFYEKDGKKLEYRVTVFSDDPTSKNVGQNFVEIMKNIGLHIELNPEACINFNKVISNKEYDITFSGYSVGAEPTTGTQQFYYSKDNNGVGTPEIDKLIEKILVEPDPQKRAQKCNEVEKKHMSEVCTLGTVYNGPLYTMCKEKLANYGTFLYDESNIDWAKVGWLK